MGSCNSLMNMRVFASQRIIYNHGRRYPKGTTLRTCTYETSPDGDGITLATVQSPSMRWHGWRSITHFASTELAPSCTLKKFLTSSGRALQQDGLHTHRVER